MRNNFPNCSELKQSENISAPALSPPPPSQKKEDKDMPLYQLPLPESIFYNLKMLFENGK